MMQGRELGLVQQLISQAAVKAFNEGLPERLSERDVVPVKLAITRELQDRV